MVAIAAALVIASIYAFPHAGRPQYRTANVERRTIARLVEASGRLDVETLVEIPAPSAGRLSAIYVQEGATVSAGQPLAQLDAEAAETLVSVALASQRAAASRVAQARAELDVAMDTKERTERLALRGLSSDSDLAAARANAAKAGAALHGAKAELSEAGHHLSGEKQGSHSLTLRAPMAGAVLLAPKWVGSIVSPEKGALFRVGSDLRALRIEATVAEADIGAVHTGQKATFTTPAFPERTFPAEVGTRSMEPQNAGAGTSYLVDLRTPNPEHLLLPGMTATVRIEVGRVENAMSVKEAALRFLPEGMEEAPPRSRVFRLASGNELVPVGVATGISDAVSTEIRPLDPRALAPGDPVVIGLFEQGRESAGGPGINLGGRR
jgi:HlyD family secretion protein